MPRTVIMFQKSAVDAGDSVSTRKVLDDDFGIVLRRRPRGDVSSYQTAGAN